MNDEKQNNELDNFFREELENLSEEKPSARDWEQMNKRIQSEGLLEKSNGRKYLLLILLALVATMVSLPFLMDNKTAIKSEETNFSESTKKAVSTENKISETTKPASIKTQTRETATNPEEQTATEPSLHLKSE